MYFKQEFGKEGEDYATKCLEEKGYRIIERNFSCRRGEIDIIAFKNQQMVFVEIKSRTSTKYGLPSEAVTKKKLNHLLKAAEYYLIVRKIKNIDIRIDVIEVYKTKNEYRINHIKQVI